MDENIVLLTDSYKMTHHLQYPPGTTEVYCYFESRGGRFPYTVFFGLQYIIKKHLIGKVVTEKKIQEAKEFCAEHFANDSFFNEEGWMYILNHHNGHLPIEIKAVSEGSIVPVKNVLFTVVNTDPKCYWLPGVLETILVQVWYSTTVATNSRIQKQIIAGYLKETHDNLDSLVFKLHDCGFRGCSSFESAGIGGASHLVNFQASDTIPGMMLLRRYYAHTMAGFSGAASEHSTVTAWGRNGELESYKNMMETFPDGMMACVVDSYNIWESIEQMWGIDLKSKVLERGKRGGILYIRPDSGDPPTVILKCLELLGKAFGTTKNSKGFKLLPQYLRIINDDGISYRTLSDILDLMKTKCWSAENVGFGSGGALLQRLDRDTQKFAYKCSEITLMTGEKRAVYKDPITDPGKASKRGRQSLLMVNGKYTTVANDERSEQEDQLETVFHNGKLIKDFSLNEIRKRAQLCDGDIDIKKFLEEDAKKHK